jgi:hypothetical protein
MFALQQIARCPMSVEPDAHVSACPLAAVDRRLEDVHQQWHEAERAYFEPESFRIAIQSAIQSLRSVTFILQSNKHRIPTFQHWYQEWQDRLRSDPLMRWMVDARNRIEKQGDLETHSYIRAEIIASYLGGGPVVEVPAQLFAGPQALISSIPSSQLGEHIRQTGTLRIQRRWVENTLPEHELLDAVAIGYGRIAELVRDAHREIGISLPQTATSARAGRLPCMIGHADSRTLNIDLADNERREFVSEDVPIDIKKAEEDIRRYGLAPEQIFGGSVDYESTLESLFKSARQMTEHDGHHISVFVIFKDGLPIKIVQNEPETHGRKYLFMRKFADDVTKIDGDAVIMIAEAWVAQYDAAKPFGRAVDSPDRWEALSATLVRRIGEPVNLAAKFDRRGKQLVLEETQRTLGGAHFMFAPVYEAWGRSIPEEWLVQDQSAVGPAAPASEG